MRAYYVLTGSQLRTLRKRAGLTQQEVEALTGMRRQYISELESSDFLDHVRIGTLAKILRAYGYTWSFLAVEPYEINPQEGNEATAEVARLKAQRDELIEVGEEFLSSFYDQSMGRSIDRKFAEWQLLIARIREGENHDAA